VVSYFRSQHNNESWLAALAAILDTCALMLAGAENPCARQARLTFAMCRHTVVDLAQVFRAAPRSGHHDRLPSEEMARLRALLAEASYGLLDTPETTAKLAKIRQSYEPYLHALSAHLYMELPPWILSSETTDNWRTSAWGRITGFTDPAGPGASPDDHAD